MATFTLEQYASIRPTITSATYVIADPTLTQADLPSVSHTAAYIAMRVLTIGSLTLLLIGLCCAAAALFRYFRFERPTVHLVDHEKVLVLNKNTIDSSFPIRIYPSSQQLFVDEDDMVIAIKTPPDDHLESTSDQGPVKTKDILPVRKKLSHQPPHQSPQQNTFMSFTLMNRLWSRDSSNCSPAVNSSSSSQQPKMSLPATPMQQTAPTVLPSTSIPTPAPDQLHINKDVLNATPRDGPEDLCSICLSGYVADDRLRILPCGHEYHAECIDIWLIHKSTQCPLCKRELLNDISSTPTRALADSV
ncbi:E3 ubiquitin-protein ligase rnf13 [Haplosporangium sp. Z 767]|nr:E3 ubiquitin-protein ligase rnf13 [Haplosporangium sp. Z 767]KAF9193009.1 E3 ubiquitin-protein ligase rnf13 [Haplosporangium sp. Z 11]